MNARISANADAETSASAPQSSCAEIISLIADVSTNTWEEETMNKKILRGVPKKTAEIPKTEERIQTEAIIRFADELIDEIQREYEKELTLGFKTPDDDGLTALVHHKKAITLEWVMRMICRKAGEK